MSTQKTNYSSTHWCIMETSIFCNSYFRWSFRTNMIFPTNGFLRISMSSEYLLTLQCQIVIDFSKTIPLIFCSYWTWIILWEKSTKHRTVSCALRQAKLIGKLPKSFELDELSLFGGLTCLIPGSASKPFRALMTAQHFSTCLFAYSTGNKNLVIQQIGRGFSDFLTSVFTKKEQFAPAGGWIPQLCFFK